MNEESPIEFDDFKDAARPFHWPQGNETFRRVLSEIGNADSTHYFANCKTQFSISRVGRHILPLTINDRIQGNSYVCSTYCGTIEYPLFELREIPIAVLRFLLRCLIRSLAPVLRAVTIDRAVSVNNWLLSTNLYPDWDGAGIDQLVAELTARYPDHAILMRSLNESTNPQICLRCRQAGFLMVASRQVYLFNSASPFMRRSNVRVDTKLLNDRSDYQRVEHDQLSASDDARIQELYSQLYIGKYSRHNPQFTTPLIRLWRESGFLTITGLRNAQGRLDGVVGCFERDGVLTAPLVGYDTSLPQRLGLYRMLMAIVLQKSDFTGAVLNLSSGAAQFKRLRGGEPEIEYTAIDCRHLAWPRRLVLRLLAWLLNTVGVFLLKRFQL